MTEPIISVRNLVVEFPLRRGLFTAVNDVSFDIMPGEILGVVGASGAGKSMTGAAIIGLIEQIAHRTGIGDVLADEVIGKRHYRDFVTRRPGPPSTVPSRGCWVRGRRAAPSASCCVAMALACRWRSRPPRK